MSQIDSYDCIAVFSHGLVSPKEKINLHLAEIAKDVSADAPIVCPAQIWYFLQEPQFQVSNRCIPILPRSAEVEQTQKIDIIHELVWISDDRNWSKIAVIAHPWDQDFCTRLLTDRGFRVYKIDCSAVTK
ncbi:MAG: hypothetical protein H7196_01160 [candidate division SR1 bacterium]|nr:hypothetical protein [candidate division SR1 bacterium]